MSDLEALIARKSRLMQNGKNTENSGVVRKIDRKIRKLQQKEDGNF